MEVVKQPYSLAKLIFILKILPAFIFRTLSLLSSNIIIFEYSKTCLKRTSAGPSQIVRFNHVSARNLLKFQQNHFPLIMGILAYKKASLIKASLTIKRLNSFLFIRFQWSMDLDVFSNNEFWPVKIGRKKRHKRK